MIKAAFATAAVLLSLALTAAASAATPVGTLSGTVTVVPSIFLCARGVPNCNAYHGTLTFCKAIRGVLVTHTPCGQPAGQTSTTTGSYQLQLPYGSYTVYLSNGNGWTLASVNVHQRVQTANFVLRRPPLPGH